ncbi:MAG: hypothetical protein FJ384_06230 [Verrucomicrobia bacterium]|nr:hypothetical protein [Verrucomicrobiota bacterium]
MRSKPLLGLLSLLMMLTVGVRAQSEGYVEARIRFISMTQPLVGVGVVNNRKAHGLVIPTDMFSEEVAYRGPARLELVQVSAKRAEDPNIPKSESPAPKTAEPRQGVKARQQTLTYSVTGAPPLAWTDLPQKQGLLHLIILVTPGKGNGMTLLNDKPGSFPPGSNRYLNLCPFPLTVRTPSGDYAVAAGGSQILRPGALDKAYYDFQLLSKEAEVLFSTRVYHLESTRKLYVLSQVGAGTRVQLKAIVDRPPPPKASDGAQVETAKK